MFQIYEKSILTSLDGINIYRGCTHGCIYCDSRSKHYQIKEPFEDVEAKMNASELLDMELRYKDTKCMINTGPMGDPYLHAEAELELTRSCLKVIDKYGFGLAIQTKSSRILRDIDLLKSINKKSKCVVQINMTTYNDDLSRLVEPNVSTSRERFEVLKIMKENGIPTILWLDPILPFINDTEENLRGLLHYAIESGVYGIVFFGFGLTLRPGSREYFYKKLSQYFPDLSEKYRLKYGDSNKIVSDNNNRLSKILHEVCNHEGIQTDVQQIYHYIHSFPCQNLRKNIVVVKS